MRFTKALKKSDHERNDSKSPSVESHADDGARLGRLVPDLVPNPELKIGGGPQNRMPLGEVVAATAQHHPAGSVTSQGLDDGGAVAGENASVIVDPHRVNRHLVAITDPTSIYAEEYRNLRTVLLQKSKNQRLKLIAVVSVAPSEGKSVTALNLAWLLAQTEGVRALVIDSDLRLPSLSQYLGVEERSGLSEVLDGDAKLSDAIIHLEPSGLHLLPGGQPRADVAEQISGPKFSRLLEQAQLGFDFVIIDAPPLGVFTDAKVLIDQADGAILVVRSNYTNYKDLDRVLEGLPRQRMLGVVLNQAEETLISGRYYDYPYYKRY